MKIHFKELNFKTIEQIVDYQSFFPGFGCKKYLIDKSKCTKHPNKVLHLSNTKVFQFNLFLSFNKTSHVA
jgi:hypothetical protein